MVTVHRFRVRDFLTDKWLYSVSKRTAKSIDAIGGEIIDGTAEEVSEEEIDGEGRHIMRGESAGTLALAGARQLNRMPLQIRILGTLPAPTRPQWRPLVWRLALIRLHLSGGESRGGLGNRGGGHKRPPVMPAALFEVSTEEVAA